MFSIILSALDGLFIAIIWFIAVYLPLRKSAKNELNRYAHTRM